MKQQPINLDQLRRIRDGSSHSIFGPSGASMWLACAGSLIPNLLAPDTAGVDAAYGTVAHGVTEQWLKTGKRPTHLVGTKEFVECGEWGFMIEIDDEMLMYAEQCVDYCEWLPGEHFVERRVDISRITPIPNQTGTIDFIAHDDDTMYVVDHKFGRGVTVYAENNPQLMLYALGALWEFDPDRKVRRVSIRIAQPRLDHFDEWEVSVDDLLVFAGWAKARMALAWSIDAPRKAGSKQCQFCRVCASCAANAKMQVELTEGVFDNLDQQVSSEAMQEFKDRLDDSLMPFDMTMIETGTLTTEQLARLKPFRKNAEKWWKGVEFELLTRVSNGEDLTPHGLKVVEGRSRSMFINTNAAIEHLEFNGVPADKCIEKKIVSPAKAAKLLRVAGHRAKNIPSLLGGFTSKPPGKPTVVPLSDKRPAMVDFTEVAFDDLESETPDDNEE